MLSPEQIEVEIAKPENRHWTPLDVIRECLGVEPTVDQVRFAKTAGRKAVEGIPAQMRLIHEDWRTAFPGIKLKPETMASLIEVNKFGTHHYQFNDRSTIVNAIDDHGARKYLTEEAEFWPVHPVVEMFWLYLERDPKEGTGFNYWINEFKSGLPQKQIETNFVSGINDPKAKAKAEKLLKSRWGD